MVNAYCQKSKVQVKSLDALGPTHLPFTIYMICMMIYIMIESLVFVPSRDVKDLTLSMVLNILII